MWLVRINTWLGLVGFKLAVFLIGFFSLAITVACALFTVAGVFQLSTVDHPLSCKVLEIKIPVGRAKYRNRYLSVDCPNSERNDYLLVKKNAEIKEGDVVTAYPQALRKNRVRLDQPTPNSVVSQILNDLELRIQQKKAVVVVEKLPNITAQPTQIYQLFQNLLTNALKFTRPDVTPQIIIKSRLATPDELQEVLGSTTAFPHHRISVADNGIGFDNEYADQIFVLFQRLNGRAEYDGTGLGLAICRKIIERHHGHIAAHGQLGAGAEFVVYLPETQNPNN